MLGKAEGRNIRIVTRWVTPGDAETRQQFAKEAYCAPPDLIFRIGTTQHGDFAEQTRAIPIVFPAVSDPVGSGFHRKLSAAGR